MGKGRFQHRPSGIHDLLEPLTVNFLIVRMNKQTYSSLVGSLRITTLIKIFTGRVKGRNYLPCRPVLN